MNILKKKVIRSKRKTLSLEIKNGELIVRAPIRATNLQIELYLLIHKAWIEKHLEKAQQQASTRNSSLLTDGELKELAKQAKQYIPQRAAYYAPLIGVSYGRITIRHQHTRWGSCSSKGNLNFNCLLMLTPPQVIDSVVVHELCHLKEMNHSKRFYDEVLRVYPEYSKWHKWLRDNGNALMLRNPD